MVASFSRLILLIFPFLGHPEMLILPRFSRFSVNHVKSNHAPARILWGPVPQERKHWFPQGFLWVASHPEQDPSQLLLLMVSWQSQKHSFYQGLTRVSGNYVNHYFFATRKCVFYQGFEGFQRYTIFSQHLWWTVPETQALFILYVFSGK